MINLVSDDDDSLTGTVSENEKEICLAMKRTCEINIKPRNIFKNDNPRLNGSECRNMSLQKQFRGESSIQNPIGLNTNSLAKTAHFL